jgi:hypothetical protein
MARAATRFGVGTRSIYDGEAVEMILTPVGNEVVLRSQSAELSVRRVWVGSCPPPRVSGWSRSRMARQAPMTRRWRALFWTT